MSVGLIDAITKMLHELYPWAGVLLAAIAAWQSKRAKDYGKNNSVDLQAAKTTAEEAKNAAAMAKEEAANAHAVGRDTNEKVDSLAVAVNGRVEQLVEAAKTAGYTQAVSEAAQQQRIG